MHTLIDRTRLIIIVGWMLILAKCVLVTWAIQHWQMPIAPGWLIWPTIACGMLATWVWLMHSARRSSS
jgi:hypothetical protein